MHAGFYCDYGEIDYFKRVFTDVGHKTCTLELPCEPGAASFFYKMSTASGLFLMLVMFRILLLRRDQEPLSSGYLQLAVRS